MAAELVGGAFLSSFLGVLFDMLSSAVIVNLIRRKKLSRELVEKLETTLDAARAVLNDAEQKQIKDQAVKKWLSNLKHVVYKADDLLDQVSTVAEIQKFSGKSKSQYHVNSQEREIVNKMENIIDTLASIVNQKDILGLKEIPKENMSWRRTTSLVKAYDIYGRDKDKEAIIKLLLDDTNDGELSVIPIVGMGGIGKTTLAQLVYHDDKVKQNFDFQAWICVSEEFDVNKVTRTIIEAITLGSYDMNDLNLLQHDLKEKLSRRKFLIVLDDVWNENYDDWTMLLKPFEHGIKGSKILITTRSRNVAYVVQTVQPHELSLLCHEDCWLVLTKHAVLSTEFIYPTLEKIGREIVNKCNGLPLAAQTLGGLLRGNYDERYWNQILKSEIWEFPEVRSKIIPALRISYYYLPSCLKQCFVYCCLYPKDYQFERHELVLLWMAENFLQPKGRKTLEEVGHEYFDELVSRSFFQCLHNDGNVFVMHDLMHDLATFYAEEFYFRAEEVGDAAKINIRTRHLSHNARGNYPISELLATCDRVKYARTFLEINLNPWIPFNMENAPCILLSQLKYLRVLSFNSFPLDHDSLPYSIGESIHLRYLDLSNTPIVKLPESLSSLFNLQTLKLRGCERLKMLPSCTQDLVNLRHLDISRTCIEEMPKGMSKLKHLQLLSYYNVGRNDENGIRELGALLNLHGSLTIAKLENVINSGEALEARIIDKKHINILELRWSLDDDIAYFQVEKDILDQLRPHRDLKELSIKGYRGTIFPEWFGHSSFNSMTKLTLDGCRNCCMLPSLGRLSSLNHLSISYFDKLERIGAEFYKNDESCPETPFPLLETLQFHGMSCWQEWHTFEWDAFPKLKELTISNCPMLIGDLPNHLPALEKLKIDGTCKQLACSLSRAPAILELSIYAVNETRMHELPLSLRSLTIGGCHLVEFVLGAITHTQLTCLQSLCIVNCDLAISFPGACMPASLQELTIWRSKNLDFPMQLQHESLQLLRISNSCDSITFFPLNAFPNITDLTISRCENLKSLGASQSLDVAISSLRALQISDCPGFVSFSMLRTVAPQLERLRVEHCPETDSFPEGGLPPKLKYLRISKCEKLLRCLASMDLHSHSLTNFRIEGPCDSVKSFPKEGCLPASLEYVHLWGFPSLETLDCKGFLHLTSLCELTIQDCPKLENVEGERLPASLIQLSCYRSPLLGKRCRMKDPQIWPKISHVRHVDVD